MLAKRVSELPADGDWLFEPKWDGLMAQVHVRSLDVNLGQLSPHLHAVQPYLSDVRFLPSIMGLLNMRLCFLGLGCHHITVYPLPS
jgi:hypothetical protein